MKTILLLYWSILIRLSQRRKKEKKTLKKLLKRETESYKNDTTQNHTQTNINRMNLK